MKHAEMAEFIRVFFAELGAQVSGRTAYNRAESWHYTIYGCKRFRTYEVFRTLKSRFLKNRRIDIASSFTRQDVFNEAISHLPIDVAQILKEKWLRSK